MRKHVVLITYGEPPTPAFGDQLKYSWRILLGLTRLVAPIPGPVLPLIAVSRGRGRNKLWSEEKYGSPLETITLEQAKGMQAVLRSADPGTDWTVHVAYEFRDPLLPVLLDRLPAGESVDVVPMYAADSAFTHEISRVTVRDWSARAGKKAASVRVLPALDVERFAEVSARYILRQLDAKQLGGADTALVLAAHGTLLEPPRPMETGREATERLCAAIQRRVASRFGGIHSGWLNHTRGGRWTEPPIEEALRSVVGAGFKKVVYYPYGFAADNAESQLEGRVALRAHAWAQSTHLDCLNADPAFLELLASQVLEANAPAAAAV